MTSGRAGPARRGHGGMAVGYMAMALSAATSLLWGATLAQLRPRAAESANYRATMSAVFVVVGVLLAVVFAVHYLRRAHGRLPTRRPPRLRRSTLIAAWAAVGFAVLTLVGDAVPATQWLALLAAVGWLACALVLDRREYRTVVDSSPASRADRLS